RYHPWSRGRHRRPRAHRRRTDAARTGRQRRRRDRLARDDARGPWPAGCIGNRRAADTRRRLSPPCGQVVPRSGHRHEGGGGMTALRDAGQVALRSIRALLRQPAWVGISLVQPVIWLLLFGALFKRTADIPGFSGGSYIQFLTPGVVVMLAI